MLVLPAFRIQITEQNQKIRTLTFEERKVMRFVSRVRFRRLGCEIAQRGVFSRETVISHMPAVKSQGV